MKLYILVICFLSGTGFTADHGETQTAKKIKHPIGISNQLEGKFGFENDEVVFIDSNKVTHPILLEDAQVKMIESFPDFPIYLEGFKKTKEGDIDLSGLTAIAEIDYFDLSKSKMTISKKDRTKAPGTTCGRWVSQPEVGNRVMLATSYNPADPGQLELFDVATKEQKTIIELTWGAHVCVPNLDANNSRTFYVLRPPGTASPDFKFRIRSYSEIREELDREKSKQTSNTKTSSSKNAIPTADNSSSKTDKNSVQDIKAQSPQPPTVHNYDPDGEMNRAKNNGTFVRETEHYRRGIGDRSGEWVRKATPSSLDQDLLNSLKGRRK